MTFKHSLLQPFALVALFGFSASALASVTISVPSDVKVLAVNSEEPELSGGIFSSSKSVTLPDGENQIVFRYSPVFQQGGDQTTVNTDAIITKFTASNTELTLEVPEYRSADKAQDFDNNPAWKLVDEKGNAVDVQQDKLIKNGIQLGRQYDAESIAYNKKGGIAAIAPTGASVAAVSAANVQVPVNSQYKTTEEQMLHYWYDKADKETKQRFIQSIIQVK
ncbi:DUF2057 family protein [Vibrio rumoiensis]|uniref:UPF0319 protein A1QC_01375 n=1 Tax=Vibrio rumoiensis 1S-45 TaxID=1188252 RepID=A0A1E5E2B2_9VIBR|nr:DUF2057 family protein [Vibrio rumoiensis]OEF25561.1 hypothetical protein A1QC_01375 [Vibrio rumoiensis 1S-45]